MSIICAPALGAGADLGEGDGALWAHRNLGSALFAAGDFAQAERELGQARSLAPASASDARNHALAALFGGDLAAAQSSLRAASDLAPGDPSVALLLALVAERSGDPAGAADALDRCVELGGAGPAVEAARVRVRARLGDPDALAALPAALDAAAAAAADPLLALATFEAPPDVRAAATLPAFVTDALPVAESRWAWPGDLDGDGDTDLLVGDGQTLRDLRREAAGWIDVTESRGLGGLLGVTSARAVDLDDDGSVDLVRGGAGGLDWHAGIAGAWDAPRPIGRESITRFLPVDFDQDGDLDFVAAGPRRPSLWQQLARGQFADVSDASGLSAAGPTIVVGRGDLDGDGDADFAFVTRRGDVVVAANSRGGRFEVRPALATAPPGAFELAVADLDADGDLDLAVAAPRGVFVLRNDGALSFSGSREPALAGTVRWPASGATSLWATDLDCDMRCDLLAATETGAILGLGLEGGSFLPATEPLAPLTACGAYPVAAGLVDGDARTDLLLARGSCGLARNVGHTGRALAILPVGTLGNRDGIGITVEARAGGRYVRRDGDGVAIPIGLGDAVACDALRIRWTNGILQPVSPAPAAATMRVEQDAGPFGSCPFLWTSTPGGFAFAGDVLASSALGLPAAPGSDPTPQPSETMALDGDSWQPGATGELTLRVTEERREVTYLDRVRVWAVDHPESVEVVPLPEDPADATGPAVLVLDHPLRPRRALDAGGRDVTDRLLAIDALAVEPHRSARFPGVCEPCTLDLDFGPVPADAELVLCLTGRAVRPTSSTRLALAQDPSADFGPPRLDVARAGGAWSAWPGTVSLPLGTTRTAAVPLTAAFPDGRARVRLTTTREIAWDRAVLQVGRAATPTVRTELPLRAAELHPRGVSASVAAGAPPDHERLRKGDLPWDPLPGLYTRTGDVTPLLLDADDRFAILAIGDECALSFPPAALPPLPGGQARTFLVSLDGWTKDGDPNTARSDSVEPLPFRAMTAYPPPGTEAYPDDEAHREYRATWNTRAAPRLSRDLAAADTAATAP